MLFVPGEYKPKDVFRFYSWKLGDVEDGLKNISSGSGSGSGSGGGRKSNAQVTVDSIATSNLELELNTITI